VRGLSGNQTFSPRYTGGTGSRACALRLGRAVDRALCKRVQHAVHSNSGLVRERVKKILGELCLRKVHVIGAQVAVGMADRGVLLRTELDALGCMGDVPVVIELKTTSATLAQHKAGYHNTCTRRPTLRSGHPNSTHVRHQLQLAFGALSIQAKHGLVVVSCADGATSYALDPQFLAVKLFEYPMAPAIGYRTSQEVCVMPAWPAHDVELLRALSLVSGLDGVEGWHREDCFPASAKLTGSSVVIVCIITGRLTPTKQRAAATAAGGIKGLKIGLVQRPGGWRAVRL
jgi:hypothetical protein